jgi:hypothetical protein
MRTVDRGAKCGNEVGNRAFLECPSLKVRAGDRFGNAVILICGILPTDISGQNS